MPFYRSIPGLFLLWLSFQCSLLSVQALAQTSETPLADSLRGAEIAPTDFGFPQQSADEFWQKAPQYRGPIPRWAQVFSVSLPQTTHAMLRLDEFHRRRNPLGNRLAALLRWQVAVSLQNDYARAYAEFDLRQSGWDDAKIADLNQQRSELSPQQKLCLQLAHKLSVAAYQVSDAQLESLRSELGNADTVALVQTIAFANFQIRLFAALDVNLDAAEPLAAFAVPAVGPAAEHEWGELPDRKPMDDLYLTATQQVYDPPAAFENSATANFQLQLQQQQQRTSRIAMPGPDQIARLDAADQQSANRIAWSRVAYGYQPEMTRQWFACLRAYQQEAKPDSLFLNSVFWVVTRSNECFY